MTEPLRIPTTARYLAEGDSFAYLGTAGRVTSVTHYAATVLVTYSRACGTGTLVLPIDQELLVLALPDSVTESPTLDPHATDPALYEVAELEALLAASPIRHVGPTELTWQPVRHGSRNGRLLTLGGQELAVLTLTEAAVEVGEVPIRVLPQPLTCSYHPIYCGLDSIRCVPVPARRSLVS